MIPKPFVYIGLTLIALALVPPALIARARTVTSASRRIHIIQNMDNMARFRAQQGNPLFADGRAMRRPVTGTVARGELADDEAYELGVVGRGWMTDFPARAAVTTALLRRGQERFAIYCSPCHGLAGYGDGMVSERAMELINNPLIATGTTWVQPKSLHDADVRDQPVGQIYNTITNGVRNMAGYAAQIPTKDRWAIVAYVKALQRSQNARPDDVPPDMRGRLPRVDLSGEGPGEGPGDGESP